MPLIPYLFCVQMLFVYCRKITPYYQAFVLRISVVLDELKNGVIKKMFKNDFKIFCTVVKFGAQTTTKGTDCDSWSPYQLLMMDENSIFKQFLKKPS
jgi:hypothetical protein